MPRDFRSALKDATSASTEGQRECAREAWCTGYRLVPQGDGTSRREPGLSYQAFCAADTALIAANLSAETGLPAAWLRLEADLGDPARRGEMIRVPFGPRMLLSEYYDLLMRRITEVLRSYEGRVREAARLSAAPFRSTGRHAVELAAATLETHLSVLLALPEAPVYRHIPSAELRAAGDPRTAGAPILETWQDAIVYANRDGTARIVASLSGAHAGLEILDLHRRCLTALGEVATHPELLEGVPCRVGDCGTMGLERAEPPADPAIEAPYSRCPACGDTMKLPTYRDWARWYAAWASSAGPLTCQRCLLGRCESCIYTGCACAAEGHQDAALTCASRPPVTGGFARLFDIKRPGGAWNTPGLAETSMEGSTCLSLDASAWFASQTGSCPMGNTTLSTPTSGQCLRVSIRPNRRGPGSPGRCASSSLAVSK